MAKTTRALLLLSLLAIAGVTSAITPAVVKAVYWYHDSGPSINIPSNLFTHIFYAFVDVDNVTYEVNISPDYAPQFYNFTATVRRKNPNVATLFSIGGGGAPIETIAAMASKYSYRKAFIDSSIKLARANGFAGMDLDWEYPVNSTEMSNLGTLLKEWRIAVTVESVSTLRKPLLLTAAFFYSSSHWGVNYPISSIKLNLDWINVMNYDYFGPSDGWNPNTTKAHAALYDPTGTNHISTDIGIQSWINSGIPKKKTVLGLPFYGYAWELVDPAIHGLDAPANGKATGAGIGPSDGSIAYKDVMVFRNAGATCVYDEQTVVNYCYSGTTWIGYDDVESVDAKISYAKTKGLLGYFGWSALADPDGILSQRAYSKWAGVI